MKGMQGAVEDGGNLSLILDELGISSIRQTDMLKRLANSGDLMSRSVAKANEEWERNDALANEVANRNDSLAAKFDMLRNRVIAVAEDVGAPLADAMLSVVDAAQPLFEAVESGARAFSEMDEAEQRAIVGAVAIIAALGPALSLFGRLASNVKVLGGALEAASRALSTTQMALGGIPKGVSAADAEMVKMTTRAKLMSTALSGAKVAAVALAGAALAALGIALKNCYDEQQRFANATDGLHRAVGALGRTGGGFELASDGAKAYAMNLSEAVKAQSDMADEIRGSFSGVNESAGKLEFYNEKIQELAGNCDGDAQKLAELKAAVDGYNSVAGTSIEVIDGQSGALSSSTWEIDRNSRAWRDNAMAQAAAEAAQKVASQMLENEMALERATAEREAAERSVQEAEEQGILVDKQLVDQLESKREEERKMGEVYQASAEEYGRLIGKQDEYRKKAEGSAVTAQTFRDRLAESGQEAESLDRAAESLGESVDDLASSLQSGGLDAGEFARLGADGFLKLRQRADMDVPAIASLVEGLDALGLDPKHLEVSDDGTISHEGALIADLNAMEVEDKGYEVNDDGTVTFHESRLNDLDLVRIGGKLYRVSDGGSAEDMAGKARAARDAVNSIPDSHDTSITAADFVSGVVDKVKGKLAEISNANVAVSASGGGYATGALLDHPLRVPRHADGGISGIVTRATLTSAGLVGEDGAEYVHRFGPGSAIVPIENSRYVRPLAKAITREMGEPRQEAGKGGDTYIIRQLTFDSSGAAGRAFEEAFRAAGIRGRA